jgi:hypothetical protein
MACPALGVAMVVAIPIAFLRVGRVYLYTAIGGRFTVQPASAVP